MEGRRDSVLRRINLYDSLIHSISVFDTRPSVDLYRLALENWRELGRGRRRLEMTPKEIECTVEVGKLTGSTFGFLREPQERRDCSVSEEDV